MEDQDKQYIKGFNVGYLLSKHDPQLLEQLLKSPNKGNEYFQGVSHGQQQHDREKLLAQLKQSQKAKDRDREF
jgi:hypothetical protein